MSSFSERLSKAIIEKRNPVLVGLDPRYDQLPRPLYNPEDTRPETIARAFTLFCCDIIDVIAPLVPAVKPQAAFFEQHGPHGMLALKQVIDYAKSKGLLVIFDGKRNDIGSTAAAYADGILGEGSAWDADALTVSPYLGDDSISPFTDIACKRNAGIFVLAKTSNPGGAMLQDLTVDGKPIYRIVAEHIEELAKKTVSENGYGQVGAVVGATWPEQLRELREAMPHTWFLVPGFGAQGGGVEDVLPAFDSNGLGAIINNSRGIIFAHRKEPYAKQFGEPKWQKAVEAATLDMIEGFLGKREIFNRYS